MSYNVFCNVSLARYILLLFLNSLKRITILRRRFFNAARFIRSCGLFNFIFRIANIVVFNIEIYNNKNVIYDLISTNPDIFRRNLLRWKKNCHLTKCI